jgi:hypothetical protein
MAGRPSPRLVSLALLGLVLVTGFLMGMAWQNSDGVQAAEAPTETAEPAPERPSRVIDQVGLAEQQRADVDRIIEHYRVEMKALDEEFREAYRPRRGELIRATRDSIKAVLDPNQRMLYDSLLEARYGSGRSGGDTSQGEGASDGDTGA